VPAGARAHVAPILAAAFGHSFWWSLILLACALVPAAFLLRQRPPAVAPDAPAGAPIEPRVLVEI